jgi:beta-alanine--pyruvate transaminase
MVRRGIYDAFMNGPDRAIEAVPWLYLFGAPIAAAGVATMDPYRDEKLFENASLKALGRCAMPGQSDD